MSDRKDPEDLTKLRDLGLTPDGDAHEGITDYTDAMRMGEDVSNGGGDIELQQQDGTPFTGYEYADELDDQFQGPFDATYDHRLTDLLLQDLASYPQFLEPQDTIPLQVPEADPRFREQEEIEQPLYARPSPARPANAPPATYLRPHQQEQQEQNEQYTGMRRSVEATVTTSTFTYATPTYLIQPEEQYTQQEDVETTQPLPDEEPEAPSKRLSGRSGIPRAPRHRDAIAVSDPPPRVSEDHVFQPQLPRRLTQGRAESGRNLMALFGNDEEPRMKYPMTIERGRKGQYYSSKHRSWDEPLPAGLTLKEVCNDYPNHVWGSGLRIFMRENWDAERIYRELPQGCKPDGAEQRKWNYLQQAMGREDDRMAQEDGHPREPQKKTPEKRKSGQGARDSDYGDDEGDWEPGSSGAKRRRMRRGSARRHGPERRDRTTYASSDFMRSEQEHNNDHENDHDAYFFKQAPVQQQVGAPISFQQAQAPPEMGSFYPSNQYPQYPRQSQFSMPPQPRMLQQPTHQPTPYLSMRPADIMALSPAQLDDAYRQLHAQLVNQFIQNRRMDDPLFRTQPFDRQIAEARQRFHDFQHRQFNALAVQHNIDISRMTQARPVVRYLYIYEAVLRSRQSSMGDAAAANRDATLNLDARRQYVGQLILWAHDLARR